MSLSTTTTTTYELLKYSRAYSQHAGTGSTQTDLEWQHFVNPVIRLTLDTKKAPEGHLESYRLRITWTFSAGTHSMDIDQRDVVFEDLDLVAYSTMLSFQAPQGMPLKAVYQGAVVGLRYQHPRVAPPGQTPQYRRFQVTLQSEAAATALIDSIRFVCPCKVNAGPPTRTARPTQTQNRGQDVTDPSVVGSLRQTVSTIPTASEGPIQSSVRRTGTAWPPFATTDATLTWNTPAPSSREASGSHAQSNIPSYADQDLSRPSSAVTASSALANHPSSQPPATPHQTSQRPSSCGYDPVRDSQDFAPPRRAVTAHGSSSDVETSLPSSSMPASSPPASSRPLPSSPVLMPPPPVPPQASLPRSSQATQTPASSAPSRSSDETLIDGHTSTFATTSVLSDVAAALKDDNGLYSLKKDDLERLVAAVIREEGFAELMSSLDKMWRIKGLAGVVGK